MLGSGVLRWERVWEITFCWDWDMLGELFPKKPIGAAEDRARKPPVISIDIDVEHLRTLRISNAEGHQFDHQILVFSGN